MHFRSAQSLAVHEAFVHEVLVALSASEVSLWRVKERPGRLGRALAFGLVWTDLQNGDIVFMVGFGGH